MVKEYQIQVVPEIAADWEKLQRVVARRFNLSDNEIFHLEVVRRSIDARKKQVKYNLKIRLYLREKFTEEPISLPDYPSVANASEVLIVGAGPAGV